MVTKTKTPSGVSKKPKEVKRSAKTSKRVLARAHGEQCFWVNDGQILSDLAELERALLGMAKDTFGHHVSKERNDFADWVEFVLGDTELAHTLRATRTLPKTHALVVKRLTIYDRE